jgi:hypothetical protein
MLFALSVTADLLSKDKLTAEMAGVDNMVRT